MYEDSTFAHLLNPEDTNLTETQKMILSCVAEAHISKVEWEELLRYVGAEKIEDVLELPDETYSSCDFKPLLQNRLQNFQNYISRFTIRVLFMSGRELRISCVGKTKVETLKNDLEMRTNLDWFGIRLFSEGVELQINMILERSADLMLVFDGDEPPPLLDDDDHVVLSLAAVDRRE